MLHFPWAKTFLSTVLQRLLLFSNLDATVTAVWRATVHSNISWQKPCEVERTAPQSARQTALNLLTMSRFLEQLAQSLEVRCVQLPSHCERVSTLRLLSILSMVTAQTTAEEHPFKQKFSHFEFSSGIFSTKEQITDNCLNLHCRWFRSSSYSCPSCQNKLSSINVQVRDLARAAETWWTIVCDVWLFGFDERTQKVLLLCHWICTLLWFLKPAAKFSLTSSAGLSWSGQKDFPL